MVGGHVRVGRGPAVQERAGGRRALLLRRGLSRAGDAGPSQRGGPRVWRRRRRVPRPPLRAGRVVSGGPERAIPRPDCRPVGPDGDPVQRSLRDAPSVLPRVRGRLLLLGARQGPARRAARAQTPGSPLARRVHLVRLRAPEPDSVRRRRRPSRRGPLDVPRGPSRSEGLVLRAAGVGGAGAARTRGVLSRAEGRLLAQSAPALRRPRRRRHVADRRSRHAHDHGLAAEAGRAAAVLYVGEHVSRLPRRGGGARGRDGVRADARGDYARPGVPGGLRRLRPADRGAHGRLRGREPVARLVRQPSRPPGGPGPDDRAVRGRGAPPRARLQAGGSHARALRPGRGPPREGGERDVSAACWTVIRSRSPSSSRRPGITTRVWRSSRRRCSCGRRSWTTTS